jgi:hypothetical protein
MPLWIILILFHPTDWGRWLALPIAALIGGALGLVILWHWVRSGSTDRITVDFVERQDGDSVAYIVTYILPFLTLVITSAWEAVGITVLFLTIMLIYVSSDMLYVNPMLAAAGWHAYSIHTSPPGSVEVVLLSKKRLIRAKTSLEAVRIGDVIWWDRGKDP